VKPAVVEKKRVTAGWTILVGSNGNRTRIGNAVMVDKDADFLFASFLLGAKPMVGSGLRPEYFYRFVLASRPVGEPTLDNFRLEELPIPQPEPGQMLLHTRWLSLDPYMRGRMSDAPSYAKPVGIGDVMEGGSVSDVVTSSVPGFAKGDIVVGYGRPTRCRWLRPSKGRSRAFPRSHTLRAPLILLFDLDQLFFAAHQALLTIPKNIRNAYPCVRPNPK
jgi:hypothetical protein